MRAYTTSRLARLHLPGLRCSTAALARQAESAGWPAVTLSLPSQRADGLTAYEPWALPRGARSGLVQHWAAEPEDLEDVAGRKVRKRTRRSTSPTGDGPQGLKAWQHRAMEARLALLAEVERLALRGAGIEAAIEAVAGMAASGALPAWLQPMVAAANVRGGGELRLAASTLRRWRGLLARRGPQALAPEPGPTAGPTAGPMAEPWLADLLQLYCRPGKPSLAWAYEQLQVERDDLPTLRTVQRTVRRLGAITRNRGRLDGSEMKAIRAYITRTVDDLEPGDVYTADGHTADLECASPETGRPFRPEIVSVLDVRTRLCVGWSAGLAEGAWLVADALRNAAATCGIPAWFYVDRGKGFINRHMGDEAVGLLGRIGTSITTALPYNSQARGVIERFHGSCWVRAARALPGFVGKDMGPQARRLFYRRTRKEIEETGVSRSLMTWADFLAWAEAQIEAYNARPHSGLRKVRDPRTGRQRHQSPIEAWADHVDAGWQPVVPAPAELDELFRPHVIRQVKRCRVRFGCEEYHSLDLEELDGETVLVGYDVRDPRRVWVRDAEHRLVAIAELDGNARPYLPLSMIEQGRERRKAGQIRRLEQKAQRLEPIAPALDSGRESAQVTEAPAAEPDPDHERWIEAQLAQQAPQAEETREQRYLRWLALDARIGNGAEIPDADLAWHRFYQETPEGISTRRLVEEYGAELILGATAGESHEVRDCADTEHQAA